MSREGQCYRLYFLISFDEEQQKQYPQHLETISRATVTVWQTPLHVDVIVWHGIKETVSVSISDVFSIILAYFPHREKIHICKNINTCMKQTQQTTSTNGLYMYMYVHAY